NTLTENDYKAKVSFVDAKRNKVTVDLKIKDGRFSAVGDMANSSGQVVDSITPATDAQRRLVKLWNEWHLNDMHAGTPEREAALEKDAPEWVKSFNDRVQWLKDRGLYEVPLPGFEDATGDAVPLYKYGS